MLEFRISGALHRPRTEQCRSISSNQTPQTQEQSEKTTSVLLSSLDILISHRFAFVSVSEDSSFNLSAGFLINISKNMRVELKYLQQRREEKNSVKQGSNSKRKKLRQAPWSSRISRWFMYKERT